MDLGHLLPSVLFSLTSVLTFIGYILFDVLDGGALRCQSKRTSKCDALSSFTNIMIDREYSLSKFIKVYNDNNFFICLIKLLYCSRMKIKKCPDQFFFPALVRFTV